MNPGGSGADADVGSPDAAAGSPGAEAADSPAADVARSPDAVASPAEGDALAGADAAV